jgi:hypothetical protein
MERIVSALGLDRYSQTTQRYEYERVRYCWGQRELETSLIQEAWGEWFPDAQVLAFAQWKRVGTWLPVELVSREEAEQWLWECHKGEVPIPEGWADFIRLWRNLGHLRNDLLHFGFRDAARKESAIPDEVRERIVSLRAAVLPLGLELSEPV